MLLISAALPIVGVACAVWFLASLFRLLSKKSRRSAFRQMLLALFLFVGSSFANHFLYMVYGYASPQEFKIAVEAGKARAAQEQANVDEQNRKEEAASKCKDDVGAFTISHEFVRRNLKAPSTAEFPSITDDAVHVSLTPSCSFRVVGWVDAQNGFGAQIRSIYVVDLARNVETDTWQLKDISIQSP